MELELLSSDVKIQKSGTKCGFLCLTHLQQTYLLILGWDISDNFQYLEMDRIKCVKYIKNRSIRLHELAFWPRWLLVQFWSPSTTEWWDLICELYHMFAYYLWVQLINIDREAQRVIGVWKEHAMMDSTLLSSLCCGKQRQRERERERGLQFLFL